MQDDFPLNKMKKEDELIIRYLDHNLSEEEIQILDQSLRKNSALRKKFYDQVNVGTALEEEFCSKLPEGKVISFKHKSSTVTLLAFAASFILAIGIIGYSFFNTKESIATLASNENAAWESSLPTLEGSELRAGLMTLKSGVATIRFSSGAEVTLEAPSEIELKTPMEGKLLSGNVVVNVPESARGFILSTPSGYAVDHGTAFGVSVNKSGTFSNFKVLEGEISLHSPKGESLFLLEHESASLNLSGISRKSIISAEESPLNLKKGEKNLRIQTDGKCQSVIRNNEIEYLDQDFLMVKLDTGSNPYERRAIFNFKQDQVDWSKIKKSRLRLNLVPCGLGHRVYLPKTNRFKVYALAEFTGVESWGNLKWGEAPTTESATLVGRFEIPRSQERGSITIESNELLVFLKSNNASEYTFILTRETAETKGSGMVHAFASDSHPEASGPTLELSF
jgi:hypothetical protein